MNVASLFGHRAPVAAPATSPAPASTEATIRIRLHRGRIVWRMVCSIAVVCGAAYALVDQGVHFGTREHFDLFNIVLHHSAYVPPDSRQVVDNVATSAEQVQRTIDGQWPVWSLVVTSLVLLTSVRAFFRELSFVHIADDAIVVSPKHLTINIETSRRVLAPIPWSAISWVGDDTYAGQPGVGIRLRDPARYLANTSLLSRPLAGCRPDRLVIPMRLLSVGRKELSELLQRYFAAHSAPADVS